MANESFNFFSVHSIHALENGRFSIVHGNIENTPEKVDIAKKIYPPEHFYFEFHDIKIDMRPVVN